MAANRRVESLEAADLLEIVTREQGTTITIEAAGEWDLGGAPAARQAIAGALMGRPECVVLDLSRLAFMDSSGVHAALELARRSTAQNVRLVIIPGPPAVRRVFEVTGLTERLPFIDKQPPGRAARPRNAPDGATGSGGSSLPPNGAGRPFKAAGAAGIGTPPSRTASISPPLRRQRPIPAQDRATYQLSSGSSPTAGKPVADPPAISAEATAAASRQQNRGMTR
ncbi:MAG: STAS domain-containing protein [Solirubrobacteraceae bacterium]